MPVDATQPVYPPTPQSPIQSAWGGAVAEGVTQRFASYAELTSKWTNPPAGAHAWVGPMSGAVGGAGVDFYYLSGTGWRPRNTVMVHAQVQSDLSIGSDGAWQQVAFFTVNINKLGNFSNWDWTAPWNGYIEVSFQQAILVGTALGYGNTIGDWSCALGVKIDSGGVIGMSSFSGRLGSWTGHGRSMLNLTAGQKITLWAQCSAPGSVKTLSWSNSQLFIRYAE